MDNIIVGVDGSTSALAALRWALAEARHHDTKVVALAAWSYLDQHPEGGRGFDAAYNADKVAEQLAADVASVEPAVEVEQRVVCDLPVSALLEAAGPSDVLAVGARGVGGFEGLLLGSVSERLLERAGCPVVVVRDEVPSTAQPVVVGYDGSDVSIEALRWAASEASARGVQLRVVHAWHVPAMGLVAGGEVFNAVRDSAQTVLDQALADPALEGVDATGHLESMGAAQAVMKHAAGASLIVSGTRGRGRLGRALLGSTSRQLAHHAPVPLVVVPLGRAD